MNAQMNYLIARQRGAEQRRAGEHARLATEVPARRRGLRDPNPIMRPSSEAYRGRPALAADRTIGGAR